jgi:hypothetical protein
VTFFTGSHEWKRKEKESEAYIDIANCICFDIHQPFNRIHTQRTPRTQPKRFGWVRGHLQVYRTEQQHRFLASLNATNMLVRRIPELTHECQFWISV